MEKTDYTELDRRWAIVLGVEFVPVPGRGTHPIFARNRTP